MNIAQKMKYLTGLLCLLLLAGTQLRGEIIRFDDRFSDASKWTVMEDQLDQKKTGAFKLDRGSFKVSGAVSTDLKIGKMQSLIFKGAAKIFIPPSQATWASGSLTLFNQKNNNRLYFMTIFKKPEMADDTCVVTINNQGGSPVKVTRDQWYQMKVEVSDLSAKMKIWQEGTVEPSSWQVESAFTALNEQYDAIGFRTFGTEVAFKDVSVETLTEAQEPTAVFGDHQLKATVSMRGILKKLEVNRDGNWEAVDFRTGNDRGYLWTVGDPKSKELRAIQMEPTDPTKGRFSKLDKGIEYSLGYAVEEGRLVVTAGLKNKSATDFKPFSCGVRLGLDLEMWKYPEWNQKYSPTLLRCEKTHFWGYFMSPKQRIMAVSSPDPVASYATLYSAGGHRIYTTTLDFLHEGPLPARHPLGLDVLPAGAERTWRIILEDAKSLDTVKAVVARSTQAPMLDCDSYTLDTNGSFKMRVISETQPSVIITGPDGKKKPLALIRDQSDLYTATYKPKGGIGLYSVQISTPSGKVTEACLSVRRPWSWYMTQARKEAVAKVQLGCSHIEGWYGLFPSYMARRVLPDKALDDAIDQKFAEIWPLMYDMQKMLPITFQNRIQNHSGAAELMAERYQATGDVKDLEFASALADFILSNQTPDGVYRNGRTYYTSVIYVAKNILTVALAEAEAAVKDPKWAVKAKAHFESAGKAVDALARDLDNIETEGEMTFEDGMISCSYSQLAMFALQQTDPEAAQKYLKAALHLKDSHKCLSQILIPDSRMNGGSLRYWESQYDVLMHPNMMNSPHGWSAWRVYGLWYLYLLTGEESYMNQVESALGSCAQLIDFKTGELRWGFVPDPYIRASVWEEDPATPGKPIRNNKVIGEQYIPMIAQWYKPAKGKWVHGYAESYFGGCCNNDVHEIFKCVGEVMFENAHVLEREDGSLVGWNCKVTRDRKGTLQVLPAESCVRRVHLNLKKGSAVQIAFADGKFKTVAKPGMMWVGPGGEPFSIRKFSETLSRVSK